MCGTSAKFSFSRMVGVKELKLHRDLRCDLAELSCLTNLQKLDGHKYRICSVVSALTSLTELSCEDDNAFTGLSCLTNLVTLRAPSTVLKTTLPLDSVLTNLKKLSIHSWEDGAISKWTNLTSLCAWHQKEQSSAEQISGLTQLRKLYTSIPDSVPFQKLTNLRATAVPYTELSPKFFASLTNLEVLHVRLRTSGLLAKHIPFLTNLRSLTLLGYYSTPQHDMILTSLTNLKKLNVSTYCGERTALPTSLTHLRLLGDVTKILSQLKTPHLKKLHVSSKDGRITRVIAQLTSLVTLSLHSYPLGTLLWLSSLTNLTELSTQPSIPRKLLTRLPNLKIIKHYNDKVGTEKLGIREIEDLIIRDANFRKNKISR